MTSCALPVTRADAQVMHCALSIVAQGDMIACVDHRERLFDLLVQRAASAGLEAPVALSRCTGYRSRHRITRLWSDLPFLNKVMLLHGLVDILTPNPMTAAPLFRLVDLQFRTRLCCAFKRSKKKRGWAWLFAM
eukprot:Skav210559  [mRNA]  locus=scaffold2317:42185:49368:+ [translate_table: standard]